MAFTGSLVRLGNYDFPLEYIEAESYKASIITQDMDSDTLASGKLDRNVLSHRPIKVEFNTRDGLTDNEIDSIMRNIRNNYLNGNIEKKVKMKAYIPELGGYETQEAYLKPNMEFTIDYIDNNTNTIYYEPISFVFTGY